MVYPKHLRARTLACGLVAQSLLNQGCVTDICALARAEGMLMTKPPDHSPPAGFWALLREPDGHTRVHSYGQEMGLASDLASTSRPRPWPGSSRSCGALPRREGRDGLGACRALSQGQNAMPSPCERGIAHHSSGEISQALRSGQALP